MQDTPKNFKLAFKCRCNNKIKVGGKWPEDLMSIGFECNSCGRVLALTAYPAQTGETDELQMPDYNVVDERR